MRQVCNVSFAAQLDSLVDEDERKKFLRELGAPPGRKVSYVTDELNALMAPAGMR